MWSSADIIDVDTYTSGPAAGLSRISFQFTVHASPNSREYQGLVVDDFGRTSPPGFIDITNYNWPPVW